MIFNNKNTAQGSIVNLGSFPKGTELKFRLHVNDTKTDYFSGPASVNSDDKTHARIQNDWSEHEALVSFEDATDFLFNDFSFSISNAGADAREYSSITDSPTIGQNYDIHIPSAHFSEGRGKKIYGLTLNIFPIHMANAYSGLKIPATMKVSRINDRQASD